MMESGQSIRHVKDKLNISNASFYTIKNKLQVFEQKKHYSVNL